MRKRLLNNWGLKLVSVVAALVVWLAVMHYADPVVPVTVPNVPITIINDDVIGRADMAYSVEGRLFTSVKVTASNSLVKNLKPEDFTAVADISKMYAATGQVPVELSCKAPGISNSQCTPQTTSLKVTLERILTKNIPIQVETEGELPQDYLLGSVKTDPYYVTVQAPESVLERIAAVRVKTDISGITENQDVLCQLHYFSEGGSELSFETAKNTSFSITETTVRLEVYTTKTLPLVLEVSGQEEVMTGYRYTGAIQSMTTVTVSGLKTRLATLNAITIPGEQLSLKELSADTEKRFDLTEYLPEGISLVEGQERYLTVTLLVEPLIVKEYSVTRIELLNTRDSYVYTVLTDPVTVQLKALEEDFKALPEELAATLDTDGYGPGEYTLGYQLDCDEVFTLVSSPLVRLRIENVTGTESETLNEESFEDME